MPPHGPMAHNGSTVSDFIVNNSGLFLVSAAQAFFALMNAAVKKLNSVEPPVSTLQLVWVRMSITYILCMIYMLVSKTPNPWLGPPGVRNLLCLRGFVGFVGLVGLYSSLQYLSLSDVTVLTFLGPMAIGVVAAIFLGEVYGIRQALAGLFSLFGVVLIARPAFLESLFGASGNFFEDADQVHRLLGVSAALINVLGTAGAYTSIRAIGKRAHVLHSMSYFSAVSVLGSTLFMITTGTPFIIPTRTEWLLLLAMIGTFGFIAQVLLTMGLQRGSAGKNSMGMYTQVIFATILQRIFFKTIPPWTSVLGAFVILGSATWSTLSKEPVVAPKPVVGDVEQDAASKLTDPQQPLLGNTEQNATYNATDRTDRT